MKLEIQIYPDFVLVEGQRVNRPTGMSFSQWEAEWAGIKDHRQFADLEDELAEQGSWKTKFDELEGQYLKLKRDIEKALNDAK